MAKKATVAESTTPTPVVKLSLNKPARELFGDYGFARIRFDNGNILVLPSYRTKGLSNLPKDDAMVELARTDTTIKIALPLTGEVKLGDVYLVEKLKYKWTKFSPVTEGTQVDRDAAVAKVVR